MPVVDPTVQLPTAEIVSARRAERRSNVEEQIRRVFGMDAHFDVELYDGDPATAVARIARESNATLVISGLGRHKIVDRVFGDETALRLIRMSPVPVLAVGAGFEHAPRRIVVGVDFSETSLRAARLAIELAGEGATLYLVHVAARDTALLAWDAWGVSYKADAGAALAKLNEQLRPSSDMTVQRVMLQGDPATELLAFAASVSADLTATGSHGHGFFGRLLVGSVATKIIRTSTVGVLTVPHGAAMTRLRTTVAPPTTTRLPRDRWASLLQEFTVRNGVRPTSVEVDDIELGAQAQEHDYPLLGISYDPHDGCVQMMLGDLASYGRHLTRSIAEPDEIDVMTDEQGRDIALRIAHGAGQTLLTFTR
jgi:nucleotide-binding universal stress UspA family protein